MNPQWRARGWAAPSPCAPMLRFVPALVARGFTPSVLTYQTSAHDALPVTCQTDVSTLGVKAPSERGGHDIRSIGAQGMERPTPSPPTGGFDSQLVEAIGRFVEVPRGEPAARFAAESTSITSWRRRHRGGHGWAPPIPPSPAVTNSLSRQRPVEMALRDRGQRLIRALTMPWLADIDPAPSGHLAKHREPFRSRSRKSPSSPKPDESELTMRTRGAPDASEDANGLSGLHEQRFIMLEPRQGAHESRQRLPVARRLAGSAVHDQIVGRSATSGSDCSSVFPARLRRPTFAGQRRTAWGVNDASGGVIGTKAETIDLKKRRARCQLKMKHFYLTSSPHRSPTCLFGSIL